MSARVLAWLAAVVGVGFGAVGTVMIVGAAAEPDSPQAVVQRYFEAVAAGDAAGALSLGAVPAGDRRLLTADVLAVQLRNAGLRQLTVGPGAVRDDRGTVPARYQLAFAGGVVAVEQDVPVVRRAGRWQLGAAALTVQLQLNQAADRMRLLGGAVPTDTVLVFPGALPVQFDTPYLELLPQDSELHFGSPTAQQVGAAPSAAGRSAATRAVLQALAGCLSAAGADCPLPSERYVPGSLRGSLRQADPASLAVVLGPSAAGELRVSGEIGFAGRWRQLDFANRPAAGSGVVTLDVQAALFAVPGLRVRWLAS